MLVPIATAPYLARTLGSTNLGEYAYLSAWATIFCFVAGFALTIYGNREIAKRRSDAAETSLAFSRMFFLQIAMSALVGTAWVVTFLLRKDVPPVELWVRIAFAATVFSSFLDVSWFLTGMDQMKELALRQVLVKVVSLLAIFLFVHDRGDLPVFAMAMAGSAFLGNLYGLRLALSRTTLRRVPFKDVVDQMRWCSGLFWPQLLMVGYANADRILIRKFASPEETACYDQALKLIAVMMAVVFALRPVMISRLTLNSMLQDKSQQMRYNSRLLALAGFIGAFLAGGVAGGAASFVPWFLGSEFQRTEIILPVLSATLLACSYGDVMVNQLMVALERNKQIMMVLLAMCCATASGYMILIPSYGALGAALVLTGANTAILGMEWFLLRDVLQLRSLIRTFVGDALSASVLAGAIMAIGRLSSPGPLLTMAQILTALVIYPCVQFALGCEIPRLAVGVLASSFKRPPRAR